MMASKENYRRPGAMPSGGEGQKGMGLNKEILIAFFFKTPILQPQQPGGNLWEKREVCLMFALWFRSTGALSCLMADR